MTSQLDHWLIMLRQRRWTLHAGGDLRSPTWLAAYLCWPDCADVVILRGEEEAVAFRTPLTEVSDLLAPEWVTWVYSAPAVWTLRAVLALTPPGSAQEHRCLMRAPSSCRIPLTDRSPATIRRL